MNAIAIKLGKLLHRRPKLSLPNSRIMIVRELLEKSVKP